MTTLMFALLALAPAAPCPDHLFTIGRNKNANIVVYDASMTSGALTASDPVTVYWIMKAQQGQRENLNVIERDKAYGFDVEPGEKPGTFSMTLKADKKKAITVLVRKGCPVALATIGGKPGILQRMFVQSKEELIEPKVEYIEIFGQDPATGASLYEKYVP